MDKITFSKNVIACEETLYRISKSIVYRDCNCEDAVQEAILKAYSNLSTLKNEEYFKTWLVRILINECYRINKNENKCVNYDEYMKDDEAVEENANYELYPAIMSLKEKVRITVVLYYIEGYSVGEISKVLKIPTGTVKSRLSVGRNQLKSILEVKL